MTRWDAIRLICNALRRLSRPDAQVNLDEYEIDWSVVAFESSQHLVTPALAVALRGVPGVRSDFQEYLEAVLELTAERNLRILEGTKLALAHLNAGGIQPLVLKGIGSLLTGLYQEPGMRLLVDIDLLVQPDEVKRASEALHGAGFHQIAGPDRWIDVETHDLPMHIHPDFPAGVELHRHVLPRYSRSILTTKACFAGACPIDFEGRSALLPRATDRMAHHIAHSEISDGGQIMGTVQLRQLLELSMLYRTLGNQVDWPDLALRFRRAGYSEALTHAFSLLEGLFGEAPPAEIFTRPDHALKRLRSVLENPALLRRGRFKMLLRAYANRFSQRPSTLLNLLQPSSWSSRFKVVRRYLRYR